MENRKQEDIERAWRIVFKGAAGKLVLEDLLDYLGHFRQKHQTPTSIVLSNVAFWILTRMGVYKAKNVTRIIDTYINWVE